MANKNTGIYGHFGNYSAAPQLPNTLGADVQTSELAVGSLATVGATLYICTNATPGAATWTTVGGGGGTQAGPWTPILVDNAGVLDITLLGTSFFNVIPGSISLVEVSFNALTTAIANGDPDISITGLPYTIDNLEVNFMQQTFEHDYQPSVVSATEMNLTSSGFLLGNVSAIALTARYATTN